MKIRNLTYFIVALLATGLLWGCGSSGSGGSDFVDLQPDPDSVATLGISNCATCHLGTPNMNKWLESKHATGNSGYSDRESCMACHNPLDDGQLMAQAFGITDVDKVVGCESCHGGGSAHRGIGSFPYPVPDAAQCIQCHTTLSVYHLRSNPFSDEITERFNDGRHTGRARTGNCAACHSHEGGVLLLSQSAKIDTVGQIEALSDKLAGLGSDLNAKTCATCHDSHSGALRGIGDVTQTVDLNTDVEADKVIFSAEYNLCTSCHQVNVKAAWNDSLGYNHAASGTLPGAFEYSLADAYLHANDPYGDNADIGYHSDSYQDRSFFDTHFSGLISKDLYYYDIKNGVAAASSDRFGNPIPEVVNNPEAMALLEEYYQEYINAPDNIAVTGYNVNPASPNACSACHDVHSANKIVGTEPLIKDAGHVLNIEPSIQTAIAYGEGIGMTHGNYKNDPFLRAANADGDLYASANCTPCHNGRDFVKMTKGAARDTLGSTTWNTVSCISCHDMVDKEGVVLTEPRTFPEEYAFEFNSGATMPSEFLDIAYIDRFGNPVTHDNNVCFECHKGRTPYDDDTEVDSVYGINYLHYSPSFATMMGTASEMIPTYEGRDYAEGNTLPLAYSAHENYNNCLGCHDVHTPYNREGFEPANLQTNLCGSCHYNAFNPETPADNYWRSFNVLRERTGVFAAVLKETITDALAAEVANDNDAAIIIQGIDGANVVLTEEQEDEYIEVFGGENYATETTDEAIAKRLKTYITGSTRDITGSRLVNNDLAKAGAIWKNFMYDDKGGWAHNSILARQLMYDATVAIGGEAALGKFCAYIIAPSADTIGVQIESPNENGYGSLIRNLDAGDTVRPIVCD